MEEAAPNGFLRWELFDPHIQDWIQETLDRHAKARSERATGASDEGCISWTVPSGTASEAWSPEELLKRAEAVYSARIQDIAPGFLNGALGTLIHASVREVIKKPSDGTPPQEFFVFYRYAEIPVEGGYLCVRDLREPARPKVGGTLILALEDARPDWPEQNVFWVDDTELFFDTKDGEMSAPYAYGKQESTASTFEEALRAESREEKRQ